MSNRLHRRKDKYQMRKDSLLTTFALAIMLTALFTTAAAADQNGRGEFKQSSDKQAPTTALPAPKITITDVTCNPCTGGSNAVLVVKWARIFNPIPVGKVIIEGYEIKGKITSCGVTSNCPRQSATVSAPANATSANVTLPCNRVDGCDYTVTVTVKYKDSTGTKTVKVSKSGSFPQIL